VALATWTDSVSPRHLFPVVPRPAAELTLAPDPPASSSARPTDAVLVAAARGGDRWAREALFRRHTPLVMGLAYRLLGSDAELEDVAQEAYYQALTSLHKLDDPQAFASWLAGIVVRCVQRLLRWRKLQKRLGLRPAVPLDAELPLVRDTPPDVAAELSEIYAILDALSAQTRVVLVLRRVDGYSIPEIAAMLECSMSTVKRRLGEADTALNIAREDPS
jgi:RNA polymerase sigma-70 factor, ECF subfamily